MHFKYLILGGCIIHRKQILLQSMSLIPITPKILGLCDENSQLGRKSSIYLKIDCFLLKEKKNSFYVFSTNRLAAA